MTSFEIARGGRLYAVILGTYQVGGNGDLANWSAPGMIGGGIGGAMDLAAGAQHVFATLEHTDSRRAAQAGREVRVPADHAELRGRDHHRPGAAAAAVTERSRSGRFTLEEIAAGFTVDEVLSLTGMTVDVADQVGVMQEAWL